MWNCVLSGQAFTCKLGWLVLHPHLFIYQYLLCPRLVENLCVRVDPHVSFGQQGCKVGAVHEIIFILQRFYLTKFRMADVQNSPYGYSEFCFKGPSKWLKCSALDVSIPVHLRKVCTPKQFKTNCSCYNFTLMFPWPLLKEGYLICCIFIWFVCLFVCTPESNWTFELNS